MQERSISPGSLIGAICLGLISAACSPEPHRSRGDEPPSVILITLDTTRADHLGCYGYFRGTSPNIDEFAAESVLYERAVSVAGTTLPVHVSLWTSVYPASHGVFSN